MLTDGQIRELISGGSISIDPFDDRRLREGKYDVALGEYILVPKNTYKVLNPTDPSILPEYSQYDITVEPFVLQPQQFVLGQTKEKIGLDSSVSMFIDGSTTLARIGLTIHQTAMFIPPGQDPHIITLEIVNSGPWAIRLTYGQKIGKVVVFRYSELNQRPAKEFNVYNAQQETTGAVFRKNW